MAEGAGVDRAIQEEALRAADASWSEKVTNTTRAGRHELRTLRDFMRAGDVLNVTRVDRLAGSIETSRTLPTAPLCWRPDRTFNSPSRQPSVPNRLNAHGPLPASEQRKRRSSSLKLSMSAAPHH
jgi:hypothetical protein